jgi:hypothetical protein
MHRTIVIMLALAATAMLLAGCGSERVAAGARLSWMCS